MKSELNILHLEDDPNDAALIQSTLEKGDIACATNRVQSREDFVAALERGGVDLVLSDFTLPAFDGISALRIAHAKWPAIPLIFVSGTIGEERAIDSLKSGATDYVLKDNLTRLVPAVRRAMQEATARDVCQRLEVQFVEAQKMEVVGHFAGGVAHDFNNILAVIMGYTDLIRTDYGQDERLRKYAGAIRHASDRASSLTRQLLVFSRQQAVQLAVLDLNEAIKEANNMLLRLLGENIEMMIVSGKDIGRIKADSGCIGQVLMNLVLNARDAMPTGGKLTIATSNVTLDETHAHAHSGAAPGDHVLLSVSDTGRGMTDDVKAHLFQAFFTTKPEGKCTGLGLATCQTIVQQFGGHIGVDSKVGQGTTFNIYFPRVEQPLDVLTGTESDGQLPRGKETILLVEDDSDLREMAATLLRRLGYTVLAAANGVEALNLKNQPGAGPVDLLFTDVVMPRMCGKELADRMQALDPRTRILFTSAYTGNAIVHQGGLNQGVALLKKPFTPSALARKVRAILDQP